MIRVRVTRATFSDGTSVPMSEEGTVLLVGPNNAGKSQALKDLIGQIRDTQFLGRALTSIELAKETDQPIEDWAEESLAKLLRDGVWRYQVPGWGEVHTSDIVGQWNQTRLAALTGAFVLHADGTTRLTAGDSQASLDFSVSMATHPVQRAYLESDLAQAMDDESRSAFGVGVAVDRYGGAVISLRIGDCPPFTHQQGRPTEQYLRGLKALPRLEDQGDGMRSYLGLFLHIAAGHHEILLIDEPEAFLHPPQARRLGALLANRSQRQQAFVATHSADVVRGALEGGSAITIVRITRQGDINHPAVLSDEAVKNLWSDPLLRYSNVLDGLFHDAVVVCEGDADCRYYSAVLDNLPREDSPESSKDPRTRDPQLLFTHCGGKARIASVSNALRAASVPVIVVADFDVLHGSELRAIVESLGGDFSTYEPDLKILTAALQSDTKPLRRVTLRDELNAHIDELPSEVLGPKDAESLRALIHSENGWDKAKRAGLSAVPQGKAYEACERLLKRLRELRLLIVPVGELERFAPGVPGHGPAWVTAALEQNLHRSPTAEAAAFVRAIREAAII
jgi:hypothetical protein